MQRHFFRAGCPKENFDCAFSGEEAIKRSSEKKYDVVLLDMTLPDLQGWEVAEAINKNQFFIVISGLPQEEIAKSFADIEITQNLVIFTKPVLPAKLIQAINDRF